MKVIRLMMICSILATILCSCGSHSKYYKVYRASEYGKESFRLKSKADTNDFDEFIKYINVKNSLIKKDSGLMIFKTDGEKHKLIDEVFRGFWYKP